MRDPDLQESGRSADGRSDTEAGATHLVDEVDQARAQQYALLSSLLSRSPDSEMIERLARLRGDATPLGVAHAALAKAARRTSADEVEREYSDLFLGLRPGGLFPYASFYHTGALQGRPLARLRETLRRVGIERAPGQSEPEDHAATLLEVMSCLAGGRIAAPPGAGREIFEQHLTPWIGRFFADLERAELAIFTPAWAPLAVFLLRSKPRRSNCQPRHRGQSRRKLERDHARFSHCLCCGRRRRGRRRRCSRHFRAAIFGGCLYGAGRADLNQAGSSIAASRSASARSSIVLALKNGSSGSGGHATVASL